MKRGHKRLPGVVAFQFAHVDSNNSTKRKMEGARMKLNIQVYWGDVEMRSAEIELSKDKFEPLSEEEKEAAIETLIRDYINQNLSVRWEVEDGTSSP